MLRAFKNASLVKKIIMSLNSYKLQDKFLEYIFPILMLPITTFTSIVVTVISVILYPFFRISTGETVTFEAPIKIKVVKVKYFFRTPIENILRNRLLFFSASPYALFVNNKYIEELPKEIYNHDNIGYSMKQKQTIVAVFETKKLRFSDGYLPAKLISYKIIEKEASFSK